METNGLKTQPSIFFSELGMQNGLLEVRDENDE